MRASIGFLDGLLVRAGSGGGAVTETRTAPGGAHHLQCAQDNVPSLRLCMMHAFGHAVIAQFDDAVRKIVSRGDASR